MSAPMKSSLSHTAIFSWNNWREESPTIDGNVGITLSILLHSSSGYRSTTYMRNGGKCMQYTAIPYFRLYILYKELYASAEPHQDTHALSMKRKFFLWKGSLSCGMQPLTENNYLKPWQPTKNGHTTAGYRRCLVVI